MCVSSVDHPPGGIAFSFSTHDANLPYACNTRSLEVPVHKPQCRKNTLRPQLGPHYKHRLESMRLRTG